MNTMISILAVVALIFLAVVCLLYARSYVRYRRAKPPATLQEKEQRGIAEQELIYGPLNSVLVCPHCRKRGSVRTRGVERKKGISGGKATGAVLTGGLSALATGLSRKEWETQAHCDHCNSTWHF